MEKPTEPAAFEVGESFARILTATTQSLVCVLDREGRILLFNEACERATGYRREEVLGRDARDLVIPPEERGAFGEFLAYVWRSGTSSPQVGHWMTKDGGRRLIAWSNHPMAGPDGVPESLVTTGIDLTDRKPPAPETADAMAGDRHAKLAEIGRLATEQRALRSVATLVASEVSPERVFTAVSEGCARVLEVNASTVVRYEDDGTAVIVGRHNRDGIDPFHVGEALPADERSAIGRVLLTGAPARVDDWGSLEGGRLAEAMLRSGYRSTAAAPILVGGARWGALAIASENPLPPDSENRLEAFCELASLAVASAQARADLIASRARLVEAGDEQRRRLERNLHDGAQQRLVSVALQLRLARAKLGPGGEAAAEYLDAASRELDAGLAELRELARGLHPAILSRHGLGRAVDALASRLPIPMELEAPDDERLPDHIEATAYYIVSEALANIAKHAQATHARVSIVQDGGVLRLEVADDGRGGADPGAGTGLLGLRDRAEAAGGMLSIASPPGRGTVITALLPVGPTPAR
jgi:PAS domain S-box-containing protein